MTNLFGRTLREDPSEAETPSHRLLLKSGLIHQIASGIYAYLPLALRSLRKIEQIIREEMDRAGAYELKMPALQPLELWQQSSRAVGFGSNLFRLVDRRERELVIAPTHEEVVTMLARLTIKSYRDLPVAVYQIQTKFRDEPRPRAGLIRVREFDMKDAYSFDADEQGLDVSYRRMQTAYENIYRRCGLPVLTVEADSGAIGGKDSHEFILPTESGEDVVLSCPKCRYAANLERAQSRWPTGALNDLLPLELVDTPDIRTIEELSTFFGIPTAETLKAVFYTADDEIVFVTIRGDLGVNEIKLKNLLKCDTLRLATEAEVKNAGLVSGSASPIGLKGIKTVADESISSGSNFVVGANVPDKHFRNANPGRDFNLEITADIALAQVGDGCPRCNEALNATQGIEVGHIFKLGTFFSDTFGAAYLGRDGAQHPVVVGCYGIGVGRLLAAAIEQSHDENGMIWPVPIAPYQVQLIILNLSNPQVVSHGNALYEELQNLGIEVLYDDREESAGVKFNDADLLGLPVRVVISPRTLRDGAVELKLRSLADSQLLAYKEAAAKTQALLKV